MKSPLTTNNQLIRWDNLKTAIEAAYTVDEIALIRNQAEAYRYALKQAKESPEVIRKAEEIKLRAERRAGEILRDMKDEGKRHTGHGNQIAKSQAETPLLSDLAITKNQSSKWQKIAEIPEEKFEAFLSEAGESTGAERLKRFQAACS